ncbi:lipopolysaccharide biosynthesis protein [Priestia megaterium]|uniref:lipopolysaccharide biosynthesis protein n=1 Tax=Priestia megaterium TaxID=1404 RepID=UPI00366B0EC8
MNETRTYKSFKNSVVAMTAQLLGILLSFITRTFFIKYLGVEYLGVNGLFTNILTILSLAELGVGTAIIYSMYKPLASGDNIKVAALMNLYAKLYRYIGIFIGMVGIILIPFLNTFIKDAPNISNLELIYVLYLLNTAVSYFFTFKRSIIIADQYGYINKFNVVLFSIVQNGIQIIILVETRNFYLFLCAQIICTILSNIFISIKADKMYPYLKKYKKVKVSTEEKKNIFKNILAMMSHKLGSVVVSGTDNLLISAFVGISSVGLYSNYVLVSNTLKAITLQGIDAVTASIGNLTATESKKHSYSVFKKVYFINYIITFYAAVFLYTLINLFISLWIGEEYLLSENIVLMIVINFYIVQMRQPSIVYINAYGLFWKIKWKSIVEAIINLIVSMVLVARFDMGIFGILLGTMISNLFTNLWWEPYVVFKYGFNRNSYEYFKTYVMDSFIFVLTIILINKVCESLRLDIGMQILVIFVIDSIIATFVLIVIYSKKDEFKYSLGIFKLLIKAIIKKKTLK